MTRHPRAVLLALLGGFLVAAGPTPQTLDAIASVRTVVAASGDRIWPGFARAPFGFLYVDDEGETLLGDDRIPSGFAGTPDGRVAGPVTWRKPALLAAMPVFGPPPVIVMGSPAATGRDPAAWQRTVIHEHFHQWQAALPDYYARTAAPDLANGDETGMWMLNYAFPYADAGVGDAFAKASRSLAQALAAREGPALRSATSDYLAQRAAFKASVSKEQWRYFDFQLWQEGVARWTEITVAQRSGRAALAASGTEELNALKRELMDPNLKERGRVSVYAFGGGEALLLDRLDPDWRGCYRVSLGLDPCWQSLGIASTGGG